MGIRESEQSLLWVAAAELPKSPGHPFYMRLNALLDAHDFDPFVEGLCRGFYAQVMGRPSLAPGRYFRLLLVGYFEGIDSERGIAWRATDSLAVRSFLRLGLEDAPARSFDDLADAAPDRCRDAPRHLHVGATTTRRGGIAQGGRPWRSMPPRSRRTPRCAASCGATPARAIRRF